MPWFKDWFDSPYYHLLYGKRDDKEAGAFIRNLVQFLAPVKGSRMLDLACGKGRHSRILAAMGFDVTGIDLSQNSINEASRYSSETLHFKVHDMRTPFSRNEFDYVFNLFTSFGYFENEDDNIRTLESVRECMTGKGLFIQDYFNANIIPEHFRAQETKMVDGVEFVIRKTIDHKRIVKCINFCDKGVDYDFREKVSLFNYDDFKAMYRKTGFHILHTFGDYNLGPFDTERSERLIIISERE